MKKCIKLLCATAVLALLLAGCAQPGDDAPEAASGEEAGTEQTQRPAGGADRLYNLALSDSKTWTVDREGNTVQTDTAASDALYESDFLELQDLATGIPRYQYKTRREDTGQRNEWGYPELLTRAALYDMDGNLLVDWQEQGYEPAFGEYVIRSDNRMGIVSAEDIPEDYHTALYHVPTGEERYVGAFTAQSLGDAFLLSDHWGTPLGILDVRGNEIAGFPPPKEYYSAHAYNGYFTANDTHPYSGPRGTEYLLDRSFRELYAFDWISGFYGAFRGDYLVYQQGDAYGVLHPEEGILFTTDGASIEYFDGELAVVQTGSYRSEEEPIRASLITPEGEERAGGFSWLVPAQEYMATDPADRFLGIQDETVMLIDRDGAVLASTAIPHLLTANVLADGFYVFTVEDGQTYSEGLLDKDLNILVPAGTYQSVSMLMDYNRDYDTFHATGNNSLIQADKTLGNPKFPTGYRTDILLPSGELIVDNVLRIHDVGPDRIAVERGFELGLMDWNGNWIVRRSIFHSLGDD